MIRNKRFIMCDGCEARPSLEQTGSGARIDFGIAIKALEKLAESVDDCGRTVPISSEDVKRTASSCAIPELESELLSCIQARQSGGCVISKVVTVDVNTNLI